MFMRVQMYSGVVEEKDIGNTVSLHPNGEKVFQKCGDDFEPVTQEVAESGAVNAVGIRLTSMDPAIQFAAEQRFPTIGSLSVQPNEVFLLLRRLERLSLSLQVQKSGYDPQCSCSIDPDFVVDQTAALA